MTDRPILRFPKPTTATRLTGNSDRRPRARAYATDQQRQRFQPTFDRLEQALSNHDAEVELRFDPNGIVPERTLVFVTAVPVQDFARVCRQAHFELFSELEITNQFELPEGMEKPSTNPRLYASLPSYSALESLLRLWRGFQNVDPPPDRATPWWRLFEHLVELRVWGPGDRFNDDTRRFIEDRLPLDNEAPVNLEVELWPASSAQKIDQWQQSVERETAALDGTVVSRCAIIETDFAYHALLISLPARSVRLLIENPRLSALITLDGIQFIVPQTIAHARPSTTTDPQQGENTVGEFVETAPYRALMLDGTPVAAHELLIGGVTIEDVHDLVRLSPVNHREHATTMASLIMRGDLDTEGEPLLHSRLLSIPVLVDEEGWTRSPNNRLFVDMIHIALTKAFDGDDALAPDAYVVNLSIGILDSQFAGHISPLARLIDWWAATRGILFVISAGNIDLPLPLEDVSISEFESLDETDRQTLAWDAMIQFAHERTLLSPAEALNALTVGAASVDPDFHNSTFGALTLPIHTLESVTPAFSSAIGFGAARSIKPDFLFTGGLHAAQIRPDGELLNLSVSRSPSTGLKVASARAGRSGLSCTRGTSPAAALTTRALLQMGDALLDADGPYSGEQLTRRELALLTRAMAVDASLWPDSAITHYDTLHDAGLHHHRAKAEVLKRYGYGYFDGKCAQSCPASGVRLLGLGTVKKDGAVIFVFPLPESMAGQRIKRRLQITIAWFSPVTLSRACYRLASLSAVASDTAIDSEETTIDGWGLLMKSDYIDDAFLKRGTVWSRRLTHDRLATPSYGSDSVIPIRVQCRDVSNGALDADLPIEFAVVVTLLVDSEVEFDIYQEVAQKLRVPIRAESG